MHPPCRCSTRYRLAGLAVVLSALGGSVGAGRAPAQSPAQSPGGTPTARAVPRVLFVGNSLTGANDLPAMVSLLARAAGHPLEAHAIVRGNTNLEDHWQEGRVPRLLETERWDFVVLQQGPSASEDGRVVLRRAAPLFDSLARRAGARTALYMVWPFRNHPADFDAVHETYALAARDVDGLFLPAGEAWRAAFRLDSTLALYQPDGLHPTPAGTYAAALVITGALTGGPLTASPARLVRDDGILLANLSPATAALLRAAAAEALGGTAGGAPLDGSRADSARSRVRRPWQRSVRYSTTSTVTIPNMPCADSACVRMWQ